MPKAATIVLGIALCAVQPACEALTGSPGWDIPICNGWRASFPTTVRVGERRNVTLEGLFNGQPGQCVDFGKDETWASNNAAVLRVTPGVLEGISPGTARVDVVLKTTTGTALATITSPDVTVVP